MEFEDPTEGYVLLLQFFESKYYLPQPIFKETEESIVTQVLLPRWSKLYWKFINEEYP